MMKHIVNTRSLRLHSHFFFGLLRFLHMVFNIPILILILRLIDDETLNHLRLEWETLSFQGDTSVMVLIVLCLGVKIFVLFVPYICFHIFS